MDGEWDLLAEFLPTNWRDLAKETGAIRQATRRFARQAFGKDSPDSEMTCGTATNSHERDFPSFYAEERQYYLLYLEKARGGS